MIVFRKLVLDDPTSKNRWRRISIVEMMIWVAVISFMFASPNWLGPSSVMVFFYTTLCGLTWRLAKIMHVGFAIVIGFSVAVAIAIAVTRFYSF